MVFSFVDGETVEVFHEEFAGAKDAGFGAEFVAEFGLELIGVDGEVFITVNVVTHEGGQGLFVSGGEAEFATGMEGSFEPDVHDLVVPATGFLPGVGILEGGEEEFGATDVIDFFADDVFNVFEDAKAEGEKGVNAGDLFVDVASAEEKLSGAGGFVFGGLAEGFGEEVGSFHETILAFEGMRWQGGG